MKMELPLNKWAMAGRASSPSRLRELTDFGTNPGALKAWYFAPTGEAAMPLVVVLHGCTQTPHGYDAGSGWSDLAEAYGFAVLFPEQQRENNPSLCFNWFEPGDSRRLSGEPLSIAQMIDAMVERHAVDRDRVYISGLSAGGAMTSNMLAAYPDKFAGGAILAGLPHGAASNVGEALQQMRRHVPSPRTSGRSLKNASPHEGRWPTISVWHGTADSVVSPSNADAILEQWRDVHGLRGEAAEADVVDGHPHRAWRSADGRVVLEEYRITGMGHGVPLDTAGDCGCGETGAFMLEAGISSTVHSARRWGLLTGLPGKLARPPRTAHEEATPYRQDGVSQVIEKALRAAGLMK